MDEIFTLWGNWSFVFFGNCVPPPRASRNSSNFSRFLTMAQSSIEFRGILERIVFECFVKLDIFARHFA